MKKFSWILLPFAIAAFFSLTFNSCKKINEATELGGDLVSAVDNVNTFDTVLEVLSDNRLLLNDSTKSRYTDDVAFGKITNDPEFGQTDASVYFAVAPSTFGTYPFFNRDSLPVIDSIVLSLAYVGSYGDTSAGAELSVQVSEIARSSRFNDSLQWNVTRPEFATLGVIGQKTIAFSKLKDTVTVFRKEGDTVRTANELRIRLDNSFGQRFLAYDTSSGSSGGYRNDSIFYSLFSGFALKATGNGNALAYFRLSDFSKTRLTFYYRVRRNNVMEKNVADFVHLITGSQANLIKRTPGNGWASYLNNGLAADDKVYLQSLPGSVASIRIPALNTLSNRVIHRAELIVPKLPSAGEDKFVPPSALFLDQVNSRDTAFSIIDDLTGASQTGAPSFSVFGGRLRTDDTYRFNVTRHVQGIITRREPNHALRLYAPLYSVINTGVHVGGKRTVNILPQIAQGRVVLGGGNLADAAKRMRLYIIYSRIPN